MRLGWNSSWAIFDILPVFVFISGRLRLFNWLLLLLRNGFRLLGFSFWCRLGLLDHNHDEVSILKPVRSNLILAFT